MHNYIQKNNINLYKQNRSRPDRICSNTKPTGAQIDACNFIGRDEFVFTAEGLDTTSKHKFNSNNNNTKACFKDAEIRFFNFGTN